MFLEDSRHTFWPAWYFCAIYDLLACSYLCTTLPTLSRTGDGYHLKARQLLSQTAILDFCLSAFEPLPVMLKAYFWLCTHGSLLVGSGDHKWCQELNMGWPCARQVPFNPMYCHAGPTLVFQTAFFLIVSRIKTEHIFLTDFYFLTFFSHLCQFFTFFFQFDCASILLQGPLVSHFIAISFFPYFLSSCICCGSVTVSTLACFSY